MEMCDEVDLGDPIDEFEKGTSEYEDSDAEKKAKSKKAQECLMRRSPK